MELRNDKKAKSAQTAALLGIFLSLILIAGIVERMIPLDFIVPGVRLGFSNVVILLSMYLFRLRSVFCLVILKCLMISMITGSISSILYSLCGSLLSFFAMALVKKIGENHIGPIGISVVGAIFHSLGQLIMAMLILENTNVFLLFPVLMILSGISGILVGIISSLSLPVIRKYYERKVV